MKDFKNVIKGLLLVLLFINLVMVSGCNIPEKNIMEGIDENKLDYVYCEKDDDCVITSTKKFECCSSCFLESINKEAELEREKWREQNCKGPRKWSEDKWGPCFEYAECSKVKEDYIAACIDNRCEMKEKER